MKPINRRGAPAANEPLWRADARERLRILLPELALNAISITCMSVVLSYRDDVSVALLVVVAGLTQLFVQGTLYVGTYLIGNETHGVNGAWLIVGAWIIASQGVFGFTGLSSLGSGALFFAGVVGILVGLVTFYATRVRWVFVMLLMNVLVLMEPMNELYLEEPSMLFVHLACFGATLALFLIRSSPARITMDYEAQGSILADPERPSHGLGVYGQVAVLAMGVSMLCLAVAIAGTPAVWRQSIEDGSVGASESAEDQPPVVTDQPTEEAQEELTTEGQTTDEVTDASSAEDGVTAEPNRTAASNLPFAWLLYALLLLPVPLQLLKRRLHRLSLERERQAANRVARIYLGILSRLETIGIVRDETHTPHEFLSENEDALVELMAPAGIGLEEWFELTDAYETARYAGLDPTESQLQTAWKLYDALPLRARETMGWIRYLTGAFWRM